MLVAGGNLWTYRSDENPVICITTNGFVKNNGEAVMGRGCALEASRKFPSLPRLLGLHLKENGNTVAEFLLRAPDPVTVITFPVKHIWSEAADPKLIAKSAAELGKLARLRPNKIFLLPRPGCGNGQLKWEDVKPLLAGLPDNVLVITNTE